MHTATQIDYPIAKSFFEKAECNGNKLILGNMNTNFWLHKEKINLDVVVDIAKRFSDSRIFIISDGQHKGFYIFSITKKVCLKLVEESQQFAHAEIA